MENWFQLDFRTSNNITRRMLDSTDDVSFEIEHDGYRFGYDDSATPGYELTDLSTGEVVVAESLAAAPSGPDGGFVNFRWGDLGELSIVDPDTGEPLVEIPAAVRSRALRRAAFSDSAMSRQCRARACRRPALGSS